MPATNTQRMPQKAWIGGVNTFNSEDSVQPNQAYTLENISIMDRPESIAKISGSRRFNQIYRVIGEALTTVIDSLYSYVKLDGTSLQMVAFHDTTGFHLATFTSSSVTTILPAATPYSLAVKDWISFEGVLYFVVGDNFVYKWTGIGTYTRLAMPIGFNPSIVEMYYGRAFYAGDTSAPNRIYISASLTPSIFNAVADFVDVLDSIGDGIVELKTLSDSLIVFKKRSLHQIQGSPPREIREISSIGVGAISRHTIQKTQLGIIFLSDLGVYTLNGGGELKKISLNIEPTVNAFLGLTNMNFSSVYYKNVYYLFYQNATSTFINVGIAFALDSLEFNVLGITTLNNFHCKSNIVLTAFQSNNDWLCFKDGTNIVLKMNNSDYPFYYKDEANQAVGLEANVTSHWEEFGNPTIIKELRSIWFTTQRPLVDLEYTVEWTRYGVNKSYTKRVVGGAVSTWNNVNWNAFLWEPANKFLYKIILPGGIQLERCRIKLKSDNANEIFSLLSYEYHFVSRREI